jgi:hypothetical protein
MSGPSLPAHMPTHRPPDHNFHTWQLLRAAGGYVAIMTGMGGRAHSKNQNSISGRGKDTFLLSTVPRPTLGPPSLLFSGYRGLSGLSMLYHGYVCMQLNSNNARLHGPALK